MLVGELRQLCKLQDEGQSLMRAAMTQLNLSARAYHRILKLARAVAGLTRSEDILSVHFCTFGGGIAVPSEVDKTRLIA